jgi:hypothetical protein
VVWVCLVKSAIAAADSCVAFFSASYCRSLCYPPLDFVVLRFVALHFSSGSLSIFDLC